jgi:phosphatidylserine/phosphatidylglycerophosphate/cardiolipin synthase-like enzyme
MQLDPMTLMWIQMATGAFGAFTLVYFARSGMRKLGFILEINAYFSPKGGCQEAIVKEIGKARREILVMAYSFAAEPLVMALVEAKKRGVHVEILLDKSCELERPSDLRIFLEHGLDPKIDHDHAVAHSKVMVIDKKTVATGSYDFTNQAENDNAENLLVIKGHPDVVGWYRDHFYKHHEHAKPTQVKAEPKDQRPLAPNPQQAAKAA